jgi:hypothetical protein
MPYGNAVIVHIGRTNTLPVSLGMDVSGDTFTSQIRALKDPTSELIAEWDVDFDTDGSDGELVLTLDDSVTELITAETGYMDLKRVTGGEPVPVFDKPLSVIFRLVVTP